MKNQTTKISVSKMESACQEVSDLLKALAHPQRLMIMGHLSQGPKTVSELTELCEASQSQLSQFLGRMKAEGLVASERQGKFQYYAVADQRLLQLMAVIQDIFCK
jgi:ArsR family transcriptional regulator